MCAPIHSEELDKLGRKSISHLVLVYDRGYTSEECYKLFKQCHHVMIKTTQLPIYAFAHCHGKIVGRYSFNPPYKSGKTYTIKISGSRDILMRILRKALTQNGPKYYNFRNAWYWPSSEGKGWFNMKYRDVYIYWEREMVKDVWSPMGEGERPSYFPSDSTVFLGRYTNYFDRRKLRKRMKKPSGILIGSD